MTRAEAMISIGLAILCHLATLAGGQPAQREPQYDPHHFKPSENPCYDEKQQPQRCVPDFINAAFNLAVEVTNTCGVREPTRFCVQSGHMGSRKVCDLCDARVPAYAHPASHLTDFNNPDNETWWQSETMLENIQYPRTVNLTLRLGKAFDITYVRLKFVSPRPESFVIYKKTHVDDEWTPWQYYSGSCRSTFKLPEKAPILPGNEAVAQCTREFSDISPLTDGNIAFPTLEGRPSAENFEESEVLQMWVTAVAIRISFVRLNTFGDEIFGDKRVLSSYYYGVSDFAVGGRCKCNGHASQCVKSTGQGAQHQLVCDCKHHTGGVDCQQCDPFYVDRPWRPATSTEANECLPCQCNNLSQRCFFDQDLYDSTGHGGHCIDCVGNTQGVHCEKCLGDHWRRPGEAHCTACQCNPTGSVDGQCDESGQCKCKPGVTGQHCDRCQNGFYEFSSAGCKDCGCEVAGSFNNTPLCSPADGACSCKANVEGQQCNRCKPGHFRPIDEMNPFGCSPCFCFGQLATCSLATGYWESIHSSTFVSGNGSWSAESRNKPHTLAWSQDASAIAVEQQGPTPVYFIAPHQFASDQRFLYAGVISFTFSLDTSNSHHNGRNRDLMLIGESGRVISSKITAQGNPTPSSRPQAYKFHVHADPQLGWNFPRWSKRSAEVDFIGILSNLSSIRLRGTYSVGDVGFLYEFSTTTAVRGLYASMGIPRHSASVEMCQCEKGLSGQFCEQCAIGFKRATKNGGRFEKCIPCKCNGHSQLCDAESGICTCHHNTTGENCERCAHGYYGDALNKTPDDCRKCDCPDNGPCLEDPDSGELICTQCPEGYTGTKCQYCADEFSGNPSERPGSCRPCDCNNNVDPNSIAMCHSLTGVCLKCAYHTDGTHCEHCAAGHWGNALAKPRADCKECRCHETGSVDQYNCRQSDGQCECQPNVVGQRCEQCEPGFYNLTSGAGCQSCDCDPLGSVNATCELVSGQCHCKPGVTGRRCDQCARMHYGFGGEEGCKRCDCDALGAERQECDVATGQCLCKDNVEGRRCDRCSENRYDMRAGCLACDDCYTLIQSRKNSLNTSISTLRENLDEIQNNPVTVNDQEFDDRVSRVKTDVEDLHSRAEKKLSGDDSTMRLQVGDLKSQLGNASRLINSVGDKFGQLDDKATRVEHELRRFNADKEGVHSELQNAIVYVESEAITEVNSEYPASGNLSHLVDEAAVIEKRMLQKIEAVRGLAAEFVGNAARALGEAKEAVFEVDTASRGVVSLEENVSQLWNELSALKQLSHHTVESATTTKREAALLLGLVEAKWIASSDESLQEITARARDINAKSAIFREKLRILSETASASDASLEMKTLRKLLNTMEHRQEILTRDLRKLANMESQALTAVNNSIEAKKRMETVLEDVSLPPPDPDDVELAKSEFHHAVNTIDATKSVLDKRVRPTAEQVEEILVKDRRSTSRNAEKALELAEKARHTVVAELITQLSGVENVSNSVVSKLDELSTRIDLIEWDLMKVEELVASDVRSKEMSVVRNAKFVQSTAEVSSERLNASAAKLNASIASLDNASHPPYDTQLDELEELLDALEVEFAGLDTDELVEQISAKEEHVAEMRSQLNNLQAEAENLERIKDSLPTSCYNVVPIEQQEGSG